MFGMKTIQQQALDLRRETAKLKTALDKTNADMEYIAMMTDIELENNEETEEISHENEI